MGRYYKEGEYMALLCITIRPVNKDHLRKDRTVIIFIDKWS